MQIKNSKSRIPACRQARKNSNRGFTLVELMVAVAIFVLITTVILARHSKFSGSILVENLAYDIALSIRKAQVYGLSIKEVEVGTDEFNAGYGLHFDNTSDNSYIFFVDKPAPGLDVGDRIYGGETEKIETLTLGGGNIISKFCVNSPLKCFPGALTSIDIIFERPNPEAFITINGDNSIKYSSAEITIRSPRGVEWNIESTGTGQISVQKP